MERKGRRSMQNPVQKILKNFIEEYDKLKNTDEWHKSCDGSYGRNQTQFLLEKYEEKLQSQIIHQN